MATSQHGTRDRILACAAFLLVHATVPATAMADLTGKWSFGPTIPLTEITQSGSTVSFSIGSWAFTGTSSGGLLDVFAPAPPGACQSAIRAGISADEKRLMGPQLTASTPPCQAFSTNLVDARRCQCDDGNTVDGDGCDARCQIETCFTCSGTPSVCTPAGDGAACDDHRDCTSGETCAAGVCGGGMPVTSCVDVTGGWLFHIDSYDYFGQHHVYETAVPLTQTGTFLQVGQFAGGIDPATGAFQLMALPPSDYFTCPQGLLSGQVAADGRTLSESGITSYIFTQAPPPGCQPAETVQVAGRRCGGGTLDPGEECDDGNGASRDGCDATCHVEQCFTCTGTPSSCTPQPDGTACDDHDASTLVDSCRVGVCNGTTPNGCERCFQRDPSAGCVARPRSPCRASTVPRKSAVTIRNVTDDRRDRFTWRWKAGAATTLAELGDPPGGDGFAVCAYAEAGGTPVLAFRATMPAGGTCDSASCWKGKGARAFAYASPSATPEGVVTGRLQAGAAGAAAVLVKARGVHLSDRPFGLPAVPVSTPIRVQVQGDNGLCVETRHDASGVTRNDPVSGIFKARGTP